MSPFRLAAFLFLTAILPFASTIAVAADDPSGSSSDQPNLLFLFADDMTYDAVRALGNSEIETPNLDRLVARGTTFRFAYNMGAWNGAVCLASRAMINSGRFLWHAHGVDGRMEQERREGRFWSEILRGAGYDTYFTGKWHVRADAHKAFDIVGNVRPGMPNQTSAGYNRPLPSKPDPWSPYDPKFGGFWKGGTHWSVVTADKAIGFLDRAAERPDPFFMYIAFNAPHDPRQAPKEYVERYPVEDIALPESFQPEYPYAKPMGCPHSLRDERLAPMPRTPHSVQVHRREYYAIITHLDAQIGRVLDRLEATGKADDTWIFFTADHGLACGKHGLLGKQNMYDHSLRVPLIVAGPGAPAGKRIDVPVYLQDIMPTTIELAGADVPEYVEFQSLLPLLRGETDEHYDAIYGAYTGTQRAVIDDGWKLILYPKAKAVRLYHVAEDPQELRDLADDPGQQDRIKRLFQKLLDLQQQMDDRLDLSGAYAELEKATL